MSINAYEQMATGVSDITSITLVTLEVIHNALLINELRFDCLVNEMLLIKQLRPCLNVQSDSIRAKVFV